MNDLVWLRHVRDQIDREDAQPLDVEALARGVHMAGHLRGEFRRAYGECHGQPGRSSVTPSSARASS